MGESDLLGRRVASLELVNGFPQLGNVAKRARDGAQTADMIRVFPTGIVTAAIRM